MKLQDALRNPSGRTRPFALTSCPNCLETQVAPLASEYVGEGRVRHSWSCDGCGHSFQTAVDFSSH